MTGFFWGFLLVFLDFSLNISGHEIGIFPDFLGFLLLFRSSLSMMDRSLSFSQLARLSRSMLLFSAGVYVLDLLGVNANLGILGHILGLCCSIGGLFAALHFTRAIFDLQNMHNIDLSAQALRNAWNALAVCQMVSCLSLMNILFNTVCALLLLGAGIYYLYRLSFSCRAWRGEAEG